MQVVAIGSWQAENPESVQALAGVLGISAYEARQRMIGNGPAVVAALAEPEMALALAEKLKGIGFAALVIDAGAVGGDDRILVRRFRFRELSLLIESRDGRLAEIPYAEIAILLAVSSIVESFETKTFTERKLSIGKTLATGGVPMFSKKEHQERHTIEERGKVLYLYGGQRPVVVFSQNGMTYDGFGAVMKLSRELNFAYLIDELRRCCPGAAYDDRLLNRLAQVRLLGPTLNPESNLDLAAEILARSLRREESEAG